MSIDGQKEKNQPTIVRWREEAILSIRLSRSLIFIPSFIWEKVATTTSEVKFVDPRRASFQLDLGFSFTRSTSTYLLEVSSSGCGIFLSSPFRPASIRTREVEGVKTGIFFHMTCRLWGPYSRHNSMRSNRGIGYRVQLQGGGDLPRGGGHPGAQIQMRGRRESCRGKAVFLFLSVYFVTMVGKV